jgi:hypothetical protein
MFIRKGYVYILIMAVPGILEGVLGGTQDAKR